ncbi:MAG: BamA/TamA family outer membrane protein [Bryobacteraceae bacterium]
MKCAWLGCVLWSSLLLAGSPEQEINVNTRYTVESVELSGDQTEVSTGLSSELKRLVGEKLNPAALDDLGRRIRRELHVRSVTHRVLRGRIPEHVKVVFDVKGVPAKFEVAIPKFLYRTEGGVTGAVEGTATKGSQSVTLGAVSDGDELAERYTGLIARYEDKRVGNDRVRFRFQFESYHEQWNRSSTDVLSSSAGDDVPGIYRTRMNFEPVATFVLARPLTLSVGTSFERFETQFPAARTESANAMVTTLRYHRRLEGSDANQQEWDAGYSLRAATSLLGSDFGYARHKGEVHYTVSWGRSAIQDDLLTGMITGRAPLFERFVLGNASTLRGWNKFDLDPLGGSRVVHNSLEYRYGPIDVFYDSGAVWDQGQTAVFRHSLGVGVRRNGLCVALAFPVREGHIEPIFMVGMNY